MSDIIDARNRIAQDHVVAPLPARICMLGRPSSRNGRMRNPTAEPGPFPVEAVLSAPDADRLASTLERLRHSGLEAFAIAGGVAFASRLGLPRPLRDVDLVIEDASNIPETLGASFLVSHVHLQARPGRMLLQLVDPATALRVDVFGAGPGVIERSRPVPFRDAMEPMVGLADMAGRLAAVLLGLASDEAVPAKHAADFLALADMVDDEANAWADHRRQGQPESFAMARAAVRELTAAKPDLLVDWHPWTPAPRCPDCLLVGRLKPAQDGEIIALLGYR